MNFTDNYEVYNASDNFVSRLNAGIRPLFYDDDAPELCRAFDGQVDMAWIRWTSIH